MILINKKIKNPLISIITVTKNSSLSLQRCIDSVSKQKFRNYEHIIIDGSSTDKTIEIIKNNKKNLRYAESKKDKNLWEAINRGIKVSQGKIIGILNSDDIFYPNALNIVIKYFKEKDVDYLLGSVLKKKVYSGFFPTKIYYKFNIFPSHSVGFFVKRHVHEKYGYYDENLKYCSDYNLIYKLVKKKLKWSSTTKTEVLGRFYYGGMSDKINFVTTMYYQAKVRLKNNENIVYVLMLSFAHIIYYYLMKYSKIIKFFFKSIKL